VLGCKKWQNINILLTTILCRGFFSTVVAMMMMEIIMNPIKVPKITADIGLVVVTSVVSAMNRPVVTEFMTCQQ
jgi:hypothetical protein